MRYRNLTILADTVHVLRCGPRLGQTFLFGLLVMAALVTACGESGDVETGDVGTTEAADGGSGDVGLTSTDVCALLSDSDIRSVLGSDLPSKPNDYPESSPYPGCSWRTGRLIVQVAQGTSVVRAPGEECSSLEIGDESLACPGSVEFVVDGSRVIVQTIEDLTPEQLAAIAEILEAKF